MTATFFLLGCGESDTPQPGAGDDTTSAGDSATTDTGEKDTVVPGSCSDSVDLIEAVEAEVSDQVRTVVTVRWTTAEPTTSYVEFGLEEPFSLATPRETEPATEHEALLLGLTGNTTYQFRVLADLDGEDVSNCVYEVTTGHLPNALPTLTTEGDGHDAYTIVPIIGTDTIVTILDGQGRVVWYRFDDRELDTFRAKLSADGEHILYNAATVAGDPEDATEIVRVSLDGTSETTVPIPLLAHDFVEHPDGTIGAIVTEYREVDGETVRGNRIVEVDGDGTTTEIWNAWNCFDPAVHHGDNAADGWTLANALDYDPDEEVYYVGMRNFSSIAKVPRGTGECEWVIGQVGNTLEFEDGSIPFLHEHQFDVLESSIVVLDNEGPAGRVSRAVEYEIDTDAGVVREIWSYIADPTRYTYVLGEPTRFENGDTFVNWSAAGQMERVSADGTSLWRINSGSGYAFGFHSIETSLYR